MPLEPGTKLGTYEILAPLTSRAGQAEAYRASDTRQRRDVVITVLPRHVADNAESQARLERDIHAIASLKHPNISTPFELVRDDSSNAFLVAEWIDGETLAGRLTRGPLPMAEALAVAMAIAAALDKAHRQGVIHRGLTPFAVALTREGAKLLDFGLGPPQPEFVWSGASGQVATQTAVSGLASLSSSAAAYMAPEQFQGAAVDARTDIFAFGAILHEMVTGRKAFEGKTQALVIAAIQSVDPEPVSKAQPMVPPAIDHLLQRCLSKDPRQRLQTAWDLLAQLQWIAGGSSQVAIPATVVTRRRQRERLVWAALGVAALLAAGLAVWAAVAFRQHPPEGPLVRFVVTSIGASQTVPISISPDGRWIIGSKGGFGTRGVDAQRLNSVVSQTLIPEDVVYQPFWSPDSRFVAYFTDRKLKKAAVSGGPPQTICDAAVPFSAGSWNRDGVILFAGGGVIQRVLAVGGQVAAVTELDRTAQETEHVAPSFLPDGRHYIYLARSSTPNTSAIYVGSLDSRQRSRLFASETKAIYAAPGYLLFNRGNTVFAQPFDASSLALTGEAIRVADNVTPGAVAADVSPALNGSAIAAVSQTGILAYRTTASPSAGSSGTEEQRLVVWFDRRGEASSPLGPAGPYVGVNLSPDEKRIALHRHDGAGGDSWVFDMPQGRMQRLTFDASQHNASPLWSPDGSRIAFASLRNNKWGLYLTRADGTGGEELVIESDDIKTPMSWSPDGMLLLYTLQNSAYDVWAVPLTGDRKPFPILQSPAIELYPQISRDGKWLAYQSNETGRSEIYVRQFPSGPGKWQVSTDGGTYPRWRADGKELFFVTAPTMTSVEIRVAGSSIQAGVPKVLFNHGNLNFGQLHPSYHRFDVAADGKRFVMTQPANAPSGGLSARITAIADGGGGPAGQPVQPAAIIVVLNWPQMLKKN